MALCTPILLLAQSADTHGGHNGQNETNETTSGNSNEMSWNEADQDGVDNMNRKLIPKISYARPNKQSAIDF